MRLRGGLVLGLALLASVGLLPGASGSREEPKLFLGGGGNLGAARGEFVEMAGPGARLVVIPASADEAERAKLRRRWEDRGFENVTVLHTSEREAALDEAFAEPLRNASAVWLTGGMQQDFARKYAETPVEDELIRLLERGGTIGGSSAGASIQTKAMICGGSVNPQVLRGFDLLPGAIVDQHFLRRNRFPRLMDAVRDHPELVGYGIDEGTALVVQGGRLRVVGSSYVARVKMLDGQLRIDIFRAGDVLPMPKDEPRDAK